MLEKLIYFFMILTILTGVFMLTRYVFLEQGMELKKQRIFYIVSYCLILVSFFTLGYNVASILSLIIGGLNLILGRKKYRLPGFLLILPLTGLMNGVAAPIILVQYLPIGQRLIHVLMLAEYCLIGIGLLVFYIKGKTWRAWFRENMTNRRPVASEYIVLCTSGMLLLTISYTSGMLFPDGDLLPKELQLPVSLIICCYEITAFFLTVTIVILIMQGNRRKFYSDKVSDMQFNVISTMADIVENRDSNTGGHIKRTAKYVEIVGKELMRQNAFPEILTESYLSDMIVAAPLHDIGKIHIPDAILNKPGRLTDEEFEIMKTHTTAGRDVLSQAKNQLGEFNYLTIALDMAEYHHEWWNGKGYPEAIAEDKIPLCARIMAVADVFDALTSKRCYKEPMPLDKAFSIIEEETGTHFDPVVAKAFLNARKDIELALAEEN